MRNRATPPSAVVTSLVTLMGPYGVFSFMSNSRASRICLVSSSSGSPCCFTSFSVADSARWLTWGSRLRMASRSSNLRLFSAFIIVNYLVQGCKMRMSPNMAAVTHIHVEFDHKLHSLQHMQAGMLRMAAQATITAIFLLICPIHKYPTQLSKSYTVCTSSSYVKRASQTHTSSHNHTTPQPISIPPLRPLLHLYDTCGFTQRLHPCV